MPLTALGFMTNLSFSQFSPDFETMMMQLHEYATDIMPNGVTRFPTLTYRKMATPRDTAITDLHLEVLQREKLWDDFEFPIYVVADPAQKELSKFGIDERRDLMIRIALPVLEEQGLVIQKNAVQFVDGVEVELDPVTVDHGPLHFLANLGDRVFYQGSQYEILDLKPDQFWGNTDIPCWLLGTCEKHKLDTATDETLDDSEDDWREDTHNPDHAL